MIRLSIIIQIIHKKKCKPHRSRMFARYPDWEYTFAACQLVAFMLAMGAQLHPGQFLHVLKKPRSFVVGLIGYLVVLPLLAVATNHVAGLDTGLALGMILIAAMPGGTLAKIFTYFGHGNIALSITLSGVATLLTPVTIPLMLRLLTKDFPEHIELPVARIIEEVVGYLLLPLLISMAVCRRFPGWKKRLAVWGVRVGLMVVVLMVAGSVGSGRIKPGTYGWRAPLAIIFYCVVGQQIMQLPFYLLRWPRQDRMAAGMEVTMRNINLALLLYASLFPGQAEVLFVLLFYAAVSMIAGLPLALRHRRLSKKEHRSEKMIETSTNAQKKSGHF
jgi:BASS family bile acid:Na+ symporter